MVSASREYFDNARVVFIRNRLNFASFGWYAGDPAIPPPEKDSLPIWRPAGMIWPSGWSYLSCLASG